MAYQPLYGRLTDSAGGCAHTLSLRGRVDDIDFWLNSQMGTVMTVNASGGEYVTNIERISKCNSRINELSDTKKFATTKEVKASIQKKIDVWKEKLKEAQERDVELRKNNKVHININLKEPDTADAEFIFNINGIRITKEQLSLLQKYREKDFLGQLGIVAAFGMIPDIKKLADGEDGAAEAFIDKRDRISKFLDDEDKKIGKLPPITLR